MDEIGLYEEILQLDGPWFVEGIEFDKKAGMVTVNVACEEFERLRCPKCSRTSPRYDKRRRRWRHLDTCQFHTFVVADVPRVEWVEHGCLTIEVGWAEQKSRFTRLFEGQVIEWLLEASTQAVGRQLNLSWNAVDGIMRRAVARGLLRRKRRRLTRISVDETSFRKRHDYVTIVTDERGIVIDVQDDAKKSSLKAFYDQLSAKQKEALKVITMDMSPAYIAVTKEQIPDAENKIAIDRFHVSMYLNKAVDDVRKLERRELSREQSQETKWTRFLWLRSSGSLDKAQQNQLDKLRKLVLKTARAWAIKEYAATLWDYSTRGWARKAWLRWYSWAIRSRLTPIKLAAQTIKAHLEGIINAIVHRADNAMAESVNSKIKTLKVRARGFRNKERFKTAILFHYGGLDMSFN